MEDNLPLYIAIASSKDTIVLSERANTLEEAVAWCEQAMPHLTGEVEQLAVVSVHVARWIRGGDGFEPARGWHWIDGAWREVESSQIHLIFREFLAHPSEEPAAMNATPPTT